MALYQWIASSGRSALLDRIAPIIQRFGLEIDEEFSSGANIYAKDQDNLGISIKQRVTVLITPNNMERSEFLVEVRSSEPMLSHGTRCEEIANQLKLAIHCQG
jgi:hypothetical protein